MSTIHLISDVRISHFSLFYMIDHIVFLGCRLGNTSYLKTSPSPLSACIFHNFATFLQAVINQNCPYKATNYSDHITIYNMRVFVLVFFLLKGRIKVRILIQTLHSVALNYSLSKKCPPVTCSSYSEQSICVGNQLINWFTT